MDSYFNFYSSETPTSAPLDPYIGLITEESNEQFNRWFMEQGHDGPIVESSGTGIFENENLTPTIPSGSACNPEGNPPKKIFLQPKETNDVDISDLELEPGRSTLEKPSLPNENALELRLEKCELMIEKLHRHLQKLGVWHVQISSTLKEVCDQLAAVSSVP